MNLVFADISNYTSEFNAAQYRRNGHVFIAIKCTEGIGFRDPKHRSFSLAAGLHHIGVAHYHFARPDLGNSPETEAQFFLNNVWSLVGPRDYLILDMERGTLIRDPSWSFAFDAYIRTHSRFKIILYGSKAWLETAPANKWLSGNPYRFWDADWSQERDYAPAGGVCVMRQSSDGVFGPEPHSVAGIGQCDVNHLRGGFATKVLSKA